MGLRVGQDRCGKSRPNGIRSPDRPVYRQSLYRLGYSAHTSLGQNINYKGMVEVSGVIIPTNRDTRIKNIEKFTINKIHKATLFSSLW